MDQFLHIRSSKFPVLPGEQDELVNDGMYGKALALYLQQQLRQRSYDAPFVCCEDWGWWVEVRMAPFEYGVCIYCCNPDSQPLEFVCTDAPVGNRKWIWREFRFVETEPYRKKLISDLIAVFEADPEIDLVGVTDEMPT